MNVYLYSFDSSTTYERDDLTGKRLAEFCDFKFVSTLRNIVPKKKKIVVSKETFYSFKKHRHLSRNFVYKYSIDPNNILIRYGKSDYSLRDRRFYKVFNTAGAIKNSCRKFSQLQLLRDNDVQVPKFSTNINHLDFPCLRRLYFHSRGNDIRIINCERDIVRGDYYTELLSNYREYRAYFFGDECIRLCLKVNPDKDNNDSSIKNTANGWVFKDHYNPKLDLEKEIIKVSKKAFLLTKLDFGAVDVLVSYDENENVPKSAYDAYIYILEINSSPRLSQYGIELFSYYFLKDIFPSTELDIDNMFTNMKVDDRDILPIKFRKIMIGRG